MRTWPSPLSLFHRVGIVTCLMTFPLSSSLLLKIFSANAQQKFNCGSTCSLQACTCKSMAFTSVIPIRNVKATIWCAKSDQVQLVHGSKCCDCQQDVWHNCGVKSVWSTWTTSTVCQLNDQLNYPGFCQGCHVSSSFLLHSLHPLCSELKNQCHQSPANSSLLIPTPSLQNSCQFHHLEGDKANIVPTS